MNPEGSVGVCVVHEAAETDLGDRIDSPTCEKLRAMCRLICLLKLLLLRSEEHRVTILGRKNSFNMLSSIYFVPR